MIETEWPLIVFTLFIQASVGLFIAQDIFRRLAYREYETGTVDRMSNAAFYAVHALFWTGLVFSFFHLGNPSHAVYAFRNLAFSWLSREIILQILFICTVALAAAMQMRHVLTIRVRRNAALVASIFGVLLVYTMSRLYMLPTIPVWNNIGTPISFFISAFLVGVLALAVVLAFQSRLHPGLARLAINRTGRAALFLIAVDIAVAAIYSLSPGAPHRFLVFVRLLLLFAGAALTVFILRQTGKKNRDSADSAVNRLVYAAFSAVFLAEGLGRYIFYAANTGTGL